MTKYSCKRLDKPSNPKVKWYIHHVEANSEAEARKVMYQRGGDWNWLNSEKTIVWVTSEFDPP